MNKVILMGRLTRDPDIRYSNQGDKQTAVARYTLAVDRLVRQNAQQSADFINCITFDKNAEFAEKYLKKGVKLVVSGRIQTGSYTNRDGVKIYTTDVVIETQEFAESKTANNGSNQVEGTNYQGSGEKPQNQANNASRNDFMNVDSNDADLPFN